MGDEPSGQWKKERPMKLRVLVHAAEEGGFWAEVPALPGCVSEGDTWDETMTNIREAAEGWLEVAAERTQADAPTQVVEVEL
jgi:predicted RNase H-like HicB family nuclease